MSVASSLIFHTMCPGKVLFYVIKLAAAYAYVHLDNISADGLPCMAQWDAKFISLYHLLTDGLVACKAASAPGHMASTTGNLHLHNVARMRPDLAGRAEADWALE